MHKYLLISVLFIFTTLIFIPISGCGQKYFYYPDQVDYGYTPSRFRQVYDHLTITSRDGTKLDAWFVPSQRHSNAKDATATVIFLHGNAANMTNQYAAVSWLPERGFNVLIFDYRGFGLSKGEPNFKGVFEDSDAVINFARVYPKVNPNKLVVLAQSIGGNNAISVIGKGNRQGIKALVVDSTFYSYPSIANHYLTGGGLLVTNSYGASRYIGDISPIPLLLLHGTADTIIPHSNSEWLFAKAKQPKQLILIPNADHITTFHNIAYQDIVVNFFKQNLLNDND